jgi:hypothetical protein
VATSLAFRGRNVCLFEAVRQDLVRNDLERRAHDNPIFNQMQRVSAVADFRVVNARWWALPLCFSICLHNDEYVNVEVDTWRCVSGASLGPSWHHFFCGAILYRRYASGQYHGAVPFLGSTISWHANRRFGEDTSGSTQFCTRQDIPLPTYEIVEGSCVSYLGLLILIGNDYRSLPAFPRLMPAVRSSWESPNASLYTVVCLRALFLLARAGGAVEGGGAKSSVGITSSSLSSSSRGSFRDSFKSCYISSRSNCSTKVINLREVLSWAFNCLYQPGFLIFLGILVGSRDSFSAS